MTEREAFENWLSRERRFQNIIRRIITDTARSIKEQNDYDSIDMLIDLLASTVTEEVRDYLINEYEQSFSEGLNGIDIDSEPYPYDSVFAYVDGKNFEDRISEYLADFGADFDENTLGNKLDLLVVTDGHRVRNDARQTAGEELNSVGFTIEKTWISMHDEKVRDTHFDLHGKTIPINEYFETYRGKALYPGGFKIPEEDCGCRCFLKITVTGG